MTIRLLIAPPATGKTKACLETVKKTLSQNLFAQVWILVPDRIQADEMRTRLVQMGGVFHVRVGTFGDLYQEILDRKGSTLPVAGPAMLHRMLQQIIGDLFADGQLQYYDQICRLPGFQLEIRDRIAELKRALIMPERLMESAQAHADPGLIDLAHIYSAYQARLQDIGWADSDGLSWLAFIALAEDSHLMSDISLLVVDGFDDFNPTQLRTLKLLAEQVSETLLTLPGTPEMTRLAHRRFVRGMEKLRTDLNVEIQTISSSPNLPPTLTQLEAGLFEQQEFAFRDRTRPPAFGSAISCGGSS